MSEYGFCKRCGETVEVGVLPQDRAQARVFQAVRERGYVKGWSCDQFLGRQLAKMAEELGEACAAGLGLLPVETQERIQLAADAGKLAFDDRCAWERVWADPGDLERVYAELADVVVTAMCAASAIEAMLEEAPGSRDVVRAALKKAEKDTGRGVR